MLSEAQERMLIVAKKGREHDVVGVFEKWDLNAAVVGEVTGDGFVRIAWHGEEVAAISVDPISTEAPVYERPPSKPEHRPAGAPIRQPIDHAAINRTLFRPPAPPHP